MRILHILYQSLPNLQGTSIRSRDILRSQLEAGLNPVALTSPFQEPIDPAFGQGVETIDGVEYHRCYNNNSGQIATDKGSGFTGRLSKFSQLFSFIRKAKRLAVNRQIDIVHAHATFFTGFAGKFAAKRRRVPFIYEVRSIWEEGANTYKKGLFFKVQKRLIRMLENHICRSADIIIVINKGLKHELIKRGIKETKIRIVGNAFLIEKGTEPHQTFIKQPAGDIRFGFIGNINYYEGLEMLVQVFQRLKEQGHPNKLIIYGNGADLEPFKRLVSGYPFIEYRGIFNPAQRSSVYQEVDVIINPRLSSFLTENVTPLKPVEAMGFKKLIIASDIGGMKELIRDGETGLLFAKGNADALFSSIQYVLDSANKSMLGEIIENAYRYVIMERSWNTNALVYRKIYEEILKMRNNEG